MWLLCPALLLVVTVGAAVCIRPPADPTAVTGDADTPKTGDVVVPVVLCRAVVAERLEVVAGAPLVVVVVCRLDRGVLGVNEAESPLRLSESATASAARETRFPVVAARVEARKPASEWVATCGVHSSQSGSNNQ